MYYGSIHGLKPSAFLIRPMPLLKYQESNAVNEARVRGILNIEVEQEALEEKHREVTEGISFGENTLRGFKIPRQTYPQ